MSPIIAFDEAALVSTVLQGVLYGLSLLMFMGTMWVLMRDGGRASNRIMISIAIIFLVLDTIHIVVDIVRINEGLVKYRDIFPGGPVAFFANPSQYTYVIQHATWILQTLLGDAVVIYRCYVVWQSIWVIIFPSILWCGVAVSGFGVVYGLSQASVNYSANIFTKGANQWTMVFFTSTLTISLISSGLLAYRIWTIERNVAFVRTSKNTLMPVLRVIVDAAILYSVTLFATLVCFITGNDASSNVADVVANLITPIISIAFYMILIRVALRRMINSHHVPSILRGMGPSETTHGIGPLQVHISHLSSNDLTQAHRFDNQAKGGQPLWHKVEYNHATHEV